jgi:hypothetical protein
MIIRGQIPEGRFLNAYHQWIAPDYRNKVSHNCHEEFK